MPRSPITIVYHFQCYKDCVYFQICGLYSLFSSFAFRLLAVTLFVTHFREFILEITPQYHERRARATFSEHVRHLGFLLRTVFLSFYLSYWLRSNLSITSGSTNFEILINLKKKKNFWLNFCLIKKSVVAQWLGTCLWC